MCRWLGLSRSQSSIAFYGHTTKLPLSFSCLVEEFKVTWATEALLYWDSVDLKCSSAGVKVGKGRKWCAHEAVEWVEGRLRHSILVGTVATDHAGLGSSTTPPFSKTRGKDNHKRILKEPRRRKLASVWCWAWASREPGPSGNSSRQQDHLGGALEGGSISLQTLGPVQCPPKPLQPSQLGPCRLTHLPALPVEMNAGAHSQRLSKELRRGEVPVTSQSSSLGLS